MEPSYLRFRIKRAWGRQKRLVQQSWPLLADRFRLHVVRRWRTWGDIRRFVISWLAVVAISFIGLWQQTADLKGHYLADGPAPGGVYVEGIVGDIPSLNPIYPENNASVAFNQLVFNSLLDYDGRGRLRGELARTWQVGEGGAVYTVKLRDDVFWHDGAKLTAEDVVFTFTAIADPDTGSPLRPNWENIQISATDEQTVVFRLPNPFTPFPHSLTTGIIPQHILGGLPPAQIRVSDFNAQPIGTGPFAFDELVAARGELQLVANERYFRGAPALAGFILRVAETPDELMGLYRNGQTTAAADLEVGQIQKVEELASSRLVTAPLSSNVYAFFNNQDDILQDRRVRQALVAASRPSRAVQALHLRHEPATSALLPEQQGYRPDLSQLEFDRPRARKLLDEAGWKQGADGIRHKRGRPLELELVTQRNDTLPAVAAVLQDDWAAVGIRLKVQLADLQKLQQDHIRPRNYQVLMTGIKLGADPDVYAYWHSSQVRDPGLNLSLYKSGTADLALEDGRTRPSGAVRAAKYHTFLRHWRRDAPAAALYRLNFFYAARERVGGVKFTQLVDAGNRFHNVEDWTARTKPTLKRLLPPE